MFRSDAWNLETPYSVDVSSNKSDTWMRIICFMYCMVGSYGGRLERYMSSCSLLFSDSWELSSIEPRQIDYTPWESHRCFTCPWFGVITAPVTMQ